jgi:hypothetical protein
VNEEDIMVLAKVAILLFYLDHQAIQTHGPIVCGGIATVLTNALQIPLGNLQPLIGERRLGFCTLNACQMITKHNGCFIVHIPGAGRTYPAPIPNNLFSIEDGCLHYDA